MSFVTHAFSFLCELGVTDVVKTALETQTDSHLEMMPLSSFVCMCESVCVCMCLCAVHYNFLTCITVEMYKPTMYNRLLVRCGFTAFVNGL